MISEGRQEQFVEEGATGAELDTIARLRHALTETEQQNEQLKAGFDARTVIGQAQGLLMAWLDVDEDQAFAYLQRISSHENKKLRDVAAEIVRTRLRPS